MPQGNVGRGASDDPRSPTWPRHNPGNGDFRPFHFLRHPGQELAADAFDPKAVGAEWTYHVRLIILSRALWDRLRHMWGNAMTRDAPAMTVQEHVPYADAVYEPPTLTVIGPVSEFTFGSIFSSNDFVTQHGGHRTPG
jgi:hypothetical protein